MTEWTPAMRRYDLYPRIGSDVCDILNDVPRGQHITVDEVISRLDPELIKDDDPADVLDVVSRLMDEECSADLGFLGMDEDGYYRRRIEEYPSMTDLVKKVRKDDWDANWEWYLSLILMGVLFGLWVVFHLYGEQWGARIIPVPFFGITLTFQDLLLAMGAVMLFWYRILNNNGHLI